MEGMWESKPCDRITEVLSFTSAWKGENMAYQRNVCGTAIAAVTKRRIKAMLDRDEMQDEIILEAGRKNAIGVPPASFDGLDLSKYSCIMKAHCSDEFLKKAEAASWWRISTKNYQPFLMAEVDGLTIYQETAVTKSYDCPQFGVVRYVYFWVPRIIARRLTGSLGASYPNYGTRPDTILED
jgi:hypothetical protein